jgi:hypothetical protein
MGDPKGEVAIIGQQQQALGLLIQTPNMSKIRYIPREKIIDRFSGSLIGSSGQKVHRLVQQDIDKLLGPDNLPINPDLVGRGDLRGQISTKFPIHRDPGVTNIFLGTST